MSGFGSNWSDGEMLAALDAVEFQGLNRFPVLSIETAPSLPDPTPKAGEKSFSKVFPDAAHNRETAKKGRCMKQTTRPESSPKISKPKGTKQRRTGGHVVKNRIFFIQVCVPVDWTDDQVIEFARSELPCDSGWVIRREGDEFLGGSPERVVCADDADRRHIVLDA